MKKLLLFVLLVITSASSFGQKIYFTDTSNVWNMYIVSYDDGETTSSGGYLAYGSAYVNKYLGDSMIFGSSYKILGDGYGGLAFVREDTLLKKVYTIRVNDTDTTEVVLYDYTLQLGDTFRTTYVAGVVTDFDSVTINGLWYKTWHITQYAPVIPYYFSEIDVIEGIGSMVSPFYLVNYGESRVDLICFANRDSISPLSKTFDGYFNNSCNNPFYVKPIGVKEVNRNTQPAQLFPDPIDKTSKIVLPFKTSSASIIISNELGQTTINTTFQNTNEFTFGDKIAVPGMYFYRVTDIETGQQFSGKFISR